MVVVDHTVNINRLIDMIKFEDTFFDNKLTDRRLRKVLFAEPDYEIIDDVTPYCYVSVAKKYQFTREGIGTEKTTFLQHLVEYNISVVVQKKEAKDTQEALYFFLDKMVNLLRANPRLGKPGAITTDQKVVRSNLMSVNRLEVKEGQEIDGFRIVLQAQVGTAWQLLLPSAITLNLIGKPLDTFGITEDIDLTEDGTLAVTQISNPGLLDVEFESDVTLDTSIENLIATIAGAEISVTLRHGTDDKVRTVVLKEIRKPTAHDVIEKSILAMTLIQ